MLPKKKNLILPIVYVFGFIFVLYYVFHGAIVWESIVRMLESGEIQKNEQLTIFFMLLIERTETAPYAFQINQYTKEWVMYGSFAWLITVLAIENSRRNYIHGKEFGTARWGTLSDIKKLFASTLEEAEIKKVKRTKFWLGRWLEKRNLFKKCELDGQAMLKAQLDDLKSQEEIRKLDGTANRKLYRERQKEICRECKESIALNKKWAWKPDQLKFDYKNRLKEIEESPVFADEEKKQQKQLAKQEYKKQLSDFFNYAKRVKKIKEKYKDADMLFTKTEKFSFHNYILNAHCLVFAGSGGGKTRNYAMPNILQAHTSFVVTDPKGEILEKAGYFLEKIKGYKIRVLNLDEKSESDGYNPFFYIHPERAGYEERVLTLIETIIINTDGGEQVNSPDPFWPKAERLFLQAIFFFTVDGFVPEERNMNTALKLIGMLEIAEDEDNRDSDLDVFARIFEERFGENHIGVQQYKEFRSKASGKTAKSIVVSAVARLAPFRPPEVQRILSYDSMDLDRLGEEKMAVFVVVPPTEDTYNFMAGMLFQQMFQELQYCATQKHKHDGQKLPVPVRFILDEFATTCKIPNFIKILAYARSFGIGISPIIQSLEQLKEMYEKAWGVIIDNCSSMLYLGNIKHMDTLKYVSEMIGKATFDKRTTGRTLGRSEGSSRNEDVVGRELMTPDEIQRMPKKNCLFIATGLPAFYSEKYVYEEHPNYRFTSDSNKAYSYHYTPVPPPEIKNGTAVVPHGEDESLMPSENAHVEITPITIDTSETAQISRLTKGIKTLEPIPDEDITVQDGENTAEEIQKKTLMELVGEEESARDRAKLTVSEETQKYLENLRTERIRIEEGLIQTVNRLGRTARTLTIISDEELAVNDGEDSLESDEKAMEFIMEDDDSYTQEEVKDVIESAVEEIGSLLDSFGNIEDLEWE